MVPLQLLSGPALLVLFVVAGVFVAAAAGGAGLWTYRDARDHGNEMAPLWGTLVAAGTLVVLLPGLVALGAYVLVGR